MWCQGGNREERKGQNVKKLCLDVFLRGSGVDEEGHLAPQKWVFSGTPIWGAKEGEDNFRIFQDNYTLISLLILHIYPNPNIIFNLTFTFKHTLFSSIRSLCIHTHSLLILSHFQVLFLFLYVSYLFHLVSLFMLFFFLFTLLSSLFFSLMLLQSSSFIWDFVLYMLYIWSLLV